ncbi:hypothetical protein DFH09DRAFT_1193344 [Mycena vulgaris]|nr:hypothetical protein DFH09DRAFT_1193344 [Mycena vulgaris]
MPAPYPLIEMPPGDFTNMFDLSRPSHAAATGYQKHGAAHNTFIQGINAMVAHAPSVPPERVQPFMVFSLAVVENIHHPHDLEETFLFPEMEKKLGAGALSHNVTQHREFVPQLLELKEYLEGEISSLESSRMRVVFTEQELRDMDAAFMKRALQTNDAAAECRVWESCHAVVCAISHISLDH